MPGLLRGMARTAVVAGTATAVSNRVSRRQANRWAAQDAPADPQEQYAAAAAAGAGRRRRGSRRAAEGPRRPEGAGGLDRGGVRGREGAHSRGLSSGGPLPSGVSAITAAVHRDLVDDDDVDREDRERPERVGRDRQQRARSRSGLPRRWRTRGRRARPTTARTPRRTGTAPRISVTQPQVLRLLRMYFWSWTKNLESPIAAIP